MSGESLGPLFFCRLNSRLDFDAFCGFVFLEEPNCDFVAYFDIRKRLAFPPHLDEGIVRKPHNNNIGTVFYRHGFCRDVYCRDLAASLDDPRFFDRGCRASEDKREYK